MVNMIKLNSIQPKLNHFSTPKRWNKPCLTFSPKLEYNGTSETLRNINYIMKRKNMKNLNATQTEQVEALFKEYGRVEVTRSEINDFVNSGEISNPSWLKTDKYKVSRGVYSLPIEGNDFSPTLTDVPLVEETPNETVTQAAFVVSSLVGNIVPEKDPVFVPWGYFKDIKKIVTSKQFYPIFVTGLSGNGKTMNVTQACALGKTRVHPS